MTSWILKNQIDTTDQPTTELKTMTISSKFPLLLIASIIGIANPTLHAGASNKSGNPFGNGTFFNYIVQISSLCGFLAWFGIALSHYKFRRNFLPGLGGLSILKYRAKFYPWAQIISMVVIVFIIIAQFITLGKHYGILDFIMIYSSIILFFLIYFGHKIYTKLTK